MINQRKFYTTVLAGLLLLIGLGYAYFNTDLSINGDALFKRATWNIHFVSPPTVSNGSVSGASVTQGAHVIGTNNDTVEYSITLTNPKDYYEFTVVAENTGTMDAMISTVSNKVYSGNTEITLPDYLKSEVRHSNGAKIKEKQLLAAGSTHTFKVRVYYRDDVTNSQLPAADTTLSFRFNVVYVQADNTAIQVVAPAFNEATPWEDVIDGIRDGVITPTVGATKTVDLGSTLGTHTLRVANTTTPAECSTQGFSQSACGLVIEFADVLGSHKMNTSETNVGGWPATSMRTYVNSDIYNALPSAIKDAIIDTSVVSGHGSSDSSNFTSTDKLYLFSSHEIREDDDGDPTSGMDYFDTAYYNTRLLDYYSVNNTSTARIKKYGNSNYNYWIRSANAVHNYAFYNINNSGASYTAGADVNSGVSPAFRIA